MLLGQERLFLNWQLSLQGPEDIDSLLLSGQSDLNEAYHNFQVAANLLAQSGQPF
ncbi:MAG TPA: hypothetical protein VGF67_18780 [Ktedonobacteraceae bacterium]|jgi:hypothetical protein